MILIVQKITTHKKIYSFDVPTPRHFFNLDSHKEIDILVYNY